MRFIHTLKCFVLRFAVNSRKYISIKERRDTNGLESQNEQNENVKEIFKKGEIMKRITMLFISLSLFLGFLTNTSISIYAQEIHPQTDSTITANWISPYEEEYIFTENGETHVIIINRQTYVLTIDGEEIIPEIEEIPLTRATVNYSTGINLTYDIPWRGAAAMTGVIIATVPYIGTVAGAIVAAIATEGNPLRITMTQYKSVESYYSSYAGIYYNKVINKNIRAYSPVNTLIYGPVDGAWFDPVRPV